MGRIKYRTSFVTNSSSTSFILVSITDDDKTMMDYLTEEIEIWKKFREDLKKNPYTIEELHHGDYYDNIQDMLDDIYWDDKEKSTVSMLEFIEQKINSIKIPAKSAYIKTFDYSSTTYAFYVFLWNYIENENTESFICQWGSP